MPHIKVYTPRDENLSAGMPRTSTEVEAWIAGLWNRVVPPEG